MSCGNGCGGCGGTKPCPDGKCPGRKRDICTHIMPFHLWATQYTPVIPKFYWDVYSQEERIRLICLELDRLRAYINYMFCELEKLFEELDEALKAAEELAEQLAAKLEECERLIEQIRTEILQLTERVTECERLANRANENAIEAYNLANEAKDIAETARDTADEAKADAEQAQATADNALQTAGEANTKANDAQADAQAASEAASEAIRVANQVAENVAEQMQEIDAQMTALDARVTDLEECCEEAKRKLGNLEQWKESVDAQLEALNIATAENPGVSLENFEASGQISSGPISTGGQQIYASVIAVDIPVNHNARSVDINELSVTVRLGHFAAYVDDSNVKQSLAGTQLIGAGEKAIPEIVDWRAQLTRAGISIRVQFSRPLWKVGTNPQGQWFEEPLQNGIPCAVAVWLDAEVS